jgi:hypothetical protein
MKTQSQKNSEEIIKLQGEIQLIDQKIINIRDNHLAHIDQKINTIYKLFMVRFNNKHKWHNKLSRKSAIIKGKQTSTKGTHSELSVLADLTKKGYWVAKSLDPHCPF